MTTRVKICGITKPEDAEYALSLGADYIGVNVYEKSPRAVPFNRLPEILEAIPKGKRILVDVAPPIERLEKYYQSGFDACQIHFNLDVSMAEVAAWSRLCGPDGLWVAPRIPNTEPRFPQILMEFCNTILLDTFDKDAYGGTGRSGENWQRFLDCTLLYQHKRWILAGGLSPDNIIGALQGTQAEFVDLSSGVEASPGIKDHEKLRDFFARVREYDRES